MFDCRTEGSTVVDGTGAAAPPADVDIRGDRIVAVGKADEPGRETLHVDAFMVAPGFVDPHTHHAAQLYWCGYATPSSPHGVTSVIGGNFGFTLAPLKESHADFTARMAKVEGKLFSLEQECSLMTNAPTRLFGLVVRGRIEESWVADVVVFDPETVDSGPAHRVYDLPGESLRLTAESAGVERVFVNSRAVIVNSETEEALPGGVLPSGRNAETVTTHYPRITG
jgi:N-acyl-D-aspartate/D-glutamate deacylase